MFPKLVAFLITLAVAAYCQDHHHHTTSHHSVVSHEVPKKVELHHHQHKAVPVPHHIHAIHGHAGHTHVTHTQAHAAPKLFIPVHEIVEDAPPPQHVVIQAPVHHIPVPIPVQRAPVQIPVQHAPVPIPVRHVEIPVQHVPVQHIPVQHNVVQAVQEKSHHTESHHEESHHGDHHEHDIDYYAHPKYEYEYKVEDPHTGDKKFQHETRDGDVVNGVYSLHEPDGSIRTVKYSSDKKSGFSADIVHKGHSTHDYHYHH